MKYNDIDLRGIRRFNKTLKQMRTNTQTEKKNSISAKIGGIAYEILTKNYMGTSFKVSEPQFTDKGLTIFATGKYIAFDEFGTGAYSQNTYKGKLPNKPITFTTRGEGGSRIKMTTQGWEYYYDNPYTKDFVNGRLGWWVGSNLGFQEGREASNRFYDSCQEIKKEIEENNK